MTDPILAEARVEIAPESCWERSEHVMSFANGEDYALHDLEADEYFVLAGPVGIRLWEMCDGVTPVGTILDTLLDEFEVDRETAAADLQEILDDLRRKGLIIEKEPIPGTT